MDVVTEIHPRRNNVCSIRTSLYHSVRGPTPTPPSERWRVGSVCERTGLLLPCLPGQFSYSIVAGERERRRVLCNIPLLCAPLSVT